MARMYDPVVARWNKVDELVEKFASRSPDNYVLGNPSIFIDPDGLDVYRINSDGTLEVEKTDDDFNTYYYTTDDGNVKIGQLNKRGN